ncbi:WD40-repeat containing protein [Chondrus crispus]|uniref:WD40-repeat containing protein n=1 Tax=Chondrus crispus TaxID=2769 RepID=R7QE65_CHOCR|nr:WD40-repeat containing protein [Chondrus crispus]CDF36807.1 WD40-repeat containing protein [Chondrus crispus]|eukprot:XP_005716626.1 WD40-repeat containing protein [Chondrus crispus]
MALLLGMENGRVLLCDLNGKGQEPREVAKRHVGSVVAFAFADRGQLVVSAGTDRLLAIAKWGAMKKARVVACGERLVGLVNPRGAAGRTLLSVGERGVVRKWDVASGREVGTGAKLPFVGGGREGDDDEEREEGVLPVAIGPCGADQIFVALSDQTILYAKVQGGDDVQRVSDVVCGNLEEVYDLRPLRTRDVVAKVANRGMRDVALATNSSCLWIMRTTPVDDAQGDVPPKLATGEIDAGEPDEGLVKEETAVWSCHAGLRGHSGIILCIDALTNPKGIGKGNTADSYLATSSRDKTARVWRRSRASGRWSCMALADGHTDAVGAVAISQRTAAGQFFIVTGAADRTIKLWSLDQVQKSAEKRERSLTDGEARADAEEQDWSTEMTSTDKSELMALSAKWTTLAHDKDINAVAVSPDCKLVATGSQDRSLKMWDVAKGTLKFTCKGHKRGIWNVTFSTVDRIVASCSGDATIRLWNVADGSCLRSFQGHMSGVLRSVFISGGTQLASAGADGIIKLWITKTGECASTFEAHSDRAWGLASIDDGETLVTGGADGIVEEWLDTTEEQELAAVVQKEEEALLEQQVHNSARAGKWSQAARGALKLGMRQKLRGVVMELIQKAEDPSEDLERMVRELSEGGKDEKKRWELVTKLFLACRDWNAVGGSKNAGVAMRVLKALFCVFGPEVLCDKLVGVEKRALVEGLDAHCRRHLERVNGLVARVTVVEHTLEKMRGLADIGDVEQSEKKKHKRKGGSRDAPPEVGKQNGVKRRRKNREEVAAEY